MTLFPLFSTILIFTRGDAEVAIEIESYCPAPDLSFAEFCDLYNAALKAQGIGGGWELFEVLPSKVHSFIGDDQVAVIYA
jgi:hypothetical protein